MPPFLSTMLAAHLASKDFGPDDLVFTTPTGEALRLANWKPRVFTPAVKTARLPIEFTPKGLRDTYAAMAINVGANAKMVQQAMGHSDIRLTLDTYAGLFEDDMDRLAAELERKSPAAEQIRTTA